LHGDAHGVTQAALSSTDRVAALAEFKLVVLAALQALQLDPGSVCHAQPTTTEQHSRPEFLVDLASRHR